MIKQRLRLFFALGIACATTAALQAPASASADRQDSFPAVAAAHPPTLSGTAADPIWQTGLVATGFVDFTTRKPAPLKTTAYLLYDGTNLYVAFVCDQTGIPITSKQSTDNVGSGLDDSVGLSVDTSGVGDEIYDFYATPRGVRYQDSTESNRYAPPWQAMANVSGSMWSAEFVIPLKDLRSSNQAWRINFQRHIAATDEDYSWAFDPNMQDVNGNSQFWPSLTGIKLTNAATRPPARADIYALESIGADRDLFQQGSGGFAPSAPPTVGLDFTVPFTNTLAAVGTLAPDFSNVEIDQQTIAPQEFQRFLSEYRPFFSQGANFVSPQVFNINDSDTLFYSPGIGKFDGGFKVEGTTGHDSLGLLDVKGAGFDDSAYGFLNSSPDQSFSLLADGVIGRRTNGLDESAQVGAIDLNPKTEFGAGFKLAQEWGTFVPDAALARDDIAVVGVNRQAYNLFAAYEDIGPYFNPIDGFTQINDISGPVGIVKFAGAGSGGSFIKQWDFNTVVDRYFDRSGAVHEADVIASAAIDFKDLFSLYPFLTNSELRQYATCYPHYTEGQTNAFDSSGIGIGYADGSASPVDASFSGGPFGLPPPTGGPSVCDAPGGFATPAYLQQYSASTSRRIGERLTLSLELDGTRERYQLYGADSQWLRRVAVDQSLGKFADVSIGYRSISGNGGFATPGQNFSFGLHDRFANQDELYVNFGSPAASATLDRLIVKFVFHIGGGAGT